MKRLIAPLFGGIFLLLASQAQGALVTTGYYLNTNPLSADYGKVVSAEFGSSTTTFVQNSPFGANADGWGSIATDGSRFFYMNNFADGALPGLFGNVVETNMAGEFAFPVDVGTTQSIFGPGGLTDFSRIAFANDQFYILNTNADAGDLFRGKIVVTDSSLNFVRDFFVAFPNNPGFGDPDGPGGGQTGIGPQTGFGTDGLGLYFFNSQGGGDIIRTNMDGTGADFTYSSSPFGLDAADWTGFAVAQVEAVSLPEIPLPPAVWLFGSGLVLLGGLSRRRRGLA